MKIAVLGKNIGITDALRSYVEKRVGRLERYLQGFGKDNIDCTAVLSVERSMHVTEVTIDLGAMTMRGEERTADMYESIDGVVEKLERQIRKYKTRLQKRYQNNETIRFENVQPLPVEEYNDKPTLVKRKKFNLKPMSSDEAILQMELLRHNFFVYQDAETEEISVVYKRKDGNYGLIEPK